VCAQKSSKLNTRKIPGPAERQIREIPLNAPLNGRELSEICLIFVRVPGEHCQLTARIDGIDRDFLFGTRAVPGLAPGCSPFPSRLGATQVSRGLALRYTNYYNVYLGFDTAFVLSGASPVTLTPRGGGRNPPAAGALGKRLLSPSRRLLSS